MVANPSHGQPLSGNTMQAGMSPRRPFKGNIARAFSLLEMLLSVTILTIVLLVITGMLDTALRQWRLADSRFSQFMEAQAAFESMTRRLSTCEMDPIYDYEYPNGSANDTPLRYVRHSDLHFVCGPATTGDLPLLTSGQHPGHAVFFHGAYGLTNQPQWQNLGNLLNSWGYFIEFSDDSPTRASFLNDGGRIAPRHRFRLKELQIPAETLRTYQPLSSNPTTGETYDWFRTPLASHAKTLAENIIALIIIPQSPDAITTTNSDLAPNYFYDTRGYQHAAHLSTALKENTRHRLPALLQLTLVALDEPSAQKLQDQNGSTMPGLFSNTLFTTADNYAADLTTLETNLKNAQLRYQIFNTTVRLRNSQ